MFEDRQLSRPYTGSNPQWHQGWMGLWFRFSMFQTLLTVREPNAPASIYEEASRHARIAD
jgi:hypothetical protein